MWMDQTNKGVQHWKRATKDYGRGERLAQSQNVSWGSTVLPPRMPYSALASLMVCPCLATPRPVNAGTTGENHLHQKPFSSKTILITNHSHHKSKQQLGQNQTRLGWEK